MLPRDNTCTKLGLAFIVLSVLVIAIPRPVSAQGTGTTTRVSVASDGTQGKGHSFNQTISADGRYVAFASDASNLVAGDTNLRTDVFVHDRQTGQTTRVSIAPDGSQGDGTSYQPSISGDGRFVAFFSDSYYWVSGLTSGHAFVRDRQAGQTTCVSVHSNGTPSNGGAAHPSISGDGRYVAFASGATNLIGSDRDGNGVICWPRDEDPDCDTNDATDIYVHDRQTRQTTRVSVASDGRQGNSHSYNPTISADGRYVAFLSDASNLVAGDTNGSTDVFVHDRQTGQTTRVSVASNGTQGNGRSDNPSISADGRYVAFESLASNLVAGDTNNARDIFVHDRQTGQTARISLASDSTQADWNSLYPSISADGRYVAFFSYARNLLQGYINSENSIYVHDRLTGQTDIVSVDPNGIPRNGRQGQPTSISGNGRYVAFTSDSVFLVPGDTNDSWDVFVRDRGAALNRTAGCKPCATAAGEPIDTATGEFYTEPKVDIDLGGPLPLFFSRTFASRLLSEGDVQSSLGSNWMHNFDIRLTKTSLPARAAKVIYQRGNIINFEQPAQQDAWLVKSTAEDTEETVYQLREGPNREYWFMDPNRSLVYRFYDAPSGLFGKLRQIQDRNGNTLTFTYETSGNLTQVTDGLGRTLTFTYNASGNLTQISDGTRTLTYTYTNGVFTSFTDAMGNKTTYLYQDPVGSLGPLLTAVQYPLGNRHHTQTYDAQGRVIKQVDAYGNALTLQYNTPSSGVTTITDALGKSRTNKHARDRVITEATDAAGKTSTITRDANDRPTAIKDRLGNTTQLSFDTETGKPALITDARGNTGSITYISQDQGIGSVTFRFRKMARIDYSGGTNEQFTYDVKGNLTQQIDRRGSVWAYTYDIHGQLLTATNPIGGVTTFTYNADGTLASKRDSDVGATTYEYDNLRRVTKIIRPDNTFIRMTYDLNNSILSQTDENNQTTAFSFDADGNLISQIDALGQTTQYQHDLMDRVVQVEDRRGKRSTATHDQLGRLKSETDANANTVQYEYNENGWWTRLIDGAGKLWQMGYDAEGRQTSKTSPVGGTIQYTMDAVGNVTGIRDPLGNTAQFTFNSMSMLSSATDPLGRQIRYSYDNLAFLTGVTPYDLGSATYNRNALGSLVSLTDLRGKNWLFGHTLMADLSSRRDPLGNETRYAYDQRRRLSQVDYPTGETERYTYDGVGNILRTQYSDGTEIGMTYDVLGRLSFSDGIALSYDPESNITNTRDGSINFAATYDDGERLKTAIYNNGTFAVTYTYDQRNLLNQVTDSLTGAVIDFTYDYDGRPTSLLRSNGITTTFSWDAASHLSRIQDGAIADQQYAYNGAGEVTQITQNLPVDPASLLSPGTDSFTYDSASQVSSSGYAYDARGRQTVSPRNTFTWDVTGRLKSTATARMEYNGLGNLIRRTETGKTTHYYYNYAIGATPIMAERDEATGQFLRYYVWTPDGRLLYLIDASTGNKVYFYHFDRIGSTLFLTNPLGAMSDSYAYTPYGTLLAHNGSSPQPFTFIGELGVRQEGTGGLYHMRARYFDAASARFLSRDPLWPRIESWSGLNPYLYAMDNPMSYADPGGKGGEGAAAKIIEIALKTWDNVDKGIKVAENVQKIVAADSGGTKGTEETKDRFAKKKTKLGARYTEAHTEFYTEAYDTLGSYWDSEKKFTVWDVMDIVGFEGAKDAQKQWVELNTGPIYDAIDAVEESKGPEEGLKMLSKARHTPGEIKSKAYAILLTEYLEQKRKDIEWYACMIETIGYGSVDNYIKAQKKFEAPDLKEYRPEFWQAVRALMAKKRKR